MMRTTAGRFSFRSGEIAKQVSTTLGATPTRSYQSSSLRRSALELTGSSIGILLYRLHTDKAAAGGASTGLDWRELFREACLNGSVLLIVGRMIIGFVAGPKGVSQLHPFVIEQPLAKRLSELLTELGAPGYTIIHQASGRGDDSDHRRRAAAAVAIRWGLPRVGCLLVEALTAPRTLRSNTLPSSPAGSSTPSR